MFVLSGLIAPRIQVDNRISIIKREPVHQNIVITVKSQPAIGRDIDATSKGMIVKEDIVVQSIVSAAVFTRAVPPTVSGLDNRVVCHLIAFRSIGAINLK